MLSWTSRGKIFECMKFPSAFESVSSSERYWSEVLLSSFLSLAQDKLVWIDSLPNCNGDGGRGERGGESNGGE